MTRQFNFRLCVLASLQLPQILPFQFLDSFQTDISEGSSPFAGNLFLRIAGFTLLRKRSAADIGQTGISTLISTFLGNLPLPTSLLPYEPLQTLDLGYQLFSPLLLLPAALLIHSQPLLQLFHLYLRAICLIAYFEILVVMLLEFGVFRYISVCLPRLALVSWQIYMFFAVSSSMKPLISCLKVAYQFCDSLRFDCSFCSESMLGSNIY